jgi:3-methyladenine DNA glycosylase AlkC
MTVPVLVRLRDVTEETWNIQNEEKLADALWGFGLTNKALFEEAPPQIYERESGRSFYPVWLLDGLDEVRSSLGDVSLYKTLALLPGVKVISIRSAVYASIRGIADKYKKTEHEILPLMPQDQKKFLQCLLADENDRAERLFQKIQKNIQVRLLAGNPLLLGLMADVAGGPHGEEIELPGSRVEFFERAVNSMWFVKLSEKGDERILELRDERDEYLTHTAQAMGMVHLRSKFSGRADLRYGLRKSGLVRVNDISGEFEFVHLTFQEYYLARSLVQAGLQAALERHWSDARYEEALALLISILYREKRFGAIEEGIAWLMQWGQKTHAKNPKTLWDLGRSPLRLAVHVLCRSGVPLEEPGSTILSGSLVHLVMKGSPRRRMALSCDPFTPSMLLAKLAQDKDGGVRWGVAGNASAGPEVLAKLAQDEETGVRGGVAWNASAGPELLAKLAKDEDGFVRWGVAGNASAGPEVLAKLARDEDATLRRDVARNPSAGPELLAKLAQDKDRYVRWDVAGNASAGPEVLAKLAQDEETGVRGGVAGNASAGPELLAKLAQGEDTGVRAGVARNASAGPELLAMLARDESADVRANVARNASAGPELLAKLARDESADVRANVAWNPSAAAELLAELARDEDASVRAGAARNASAGPELLAKLARDESARVRVDVARNRSAGAELLAELARDEDARVRAGVAGNASAGMEVLAKLARDEDRYVRMGVAGNASVLLEDLVKHGVVFQVIHKIERALRLMTRRT